MELKLTITIMGLIIAVGGFVINYRKFRKDTAAELEKAIRHSIEQELELKTLNEKFNEYVKSTEFSTFKEKLNNTEKDMQRIETTVNSLRSELNSKLDKMTELLVRIGNK